MEVAEPPLTVDAAARARIEALSRVRMQQAAYFRIRRGARLADISLARSEWGLAVLEMIEALVAEAEAEDRRDPVLAANRCLLAGSPAGSAHGACDRAWRDYQEIRKTGDQAAIAAARVAGDAGRLDAGTGRPPRGRRPAARRGSARLSR
jgi:hypothetical protein